jgi:hypothetical protein
MCVLWWTKQHWGRLCPSTSVSSATHSTLLHTHHHYHPGFVQWAKLWATYQVDPVSPNKQTNKQRNSVALGRQRPIDHRLSAKLVSTFADRVCRVASGTRSLRPYSRFSRPEPLLFFQVAPKLYSRGWLVPVLDQLLLRKSGSAWNRTRTSWSVDRNADHWSTEAALVLSQPKKTKVN